MGRATVPLSTPDQAIRVAALARPRLPTLLHQGLTRNNYTKIVMGAIGGTRGVTRLLQRDLPSGRIRLFRTRFLVPSHTTQRRRLVRHVNGNSTPRHQGSLVIINARIVRRSLSVSLSILIARLYPVSLLLRHVKQLRHRHHDHPTPLRRTYYTILSAKRSTFSTNDRTMCKR